MSTVRKLLEAKGKNAVKYSISSQDTVLEALKVMARENISAVFVTESSRIAGIFTERDYVRKGELEGRLADSTPVKDVMTRNVYTVTMDTSVEQCIALMNAHHIRHLPVVENEQLVGLVSIRDVISAVLADRDSEIKGLENFIMGSDFAS
jgi:CBS domain-containing protein